MVNNFVAVQTTQKYIIVYWRCAWYNSGDYSRIALMKVEAMYFRTDYTLLCLQNTQADAWAALDPAPHVFLRERSVNPSSTT